MLASLYRRSEGFLFNDFFDASSQFSVAYKNTIAAGNLNCNLQSSNFEATFLLEIVALCALNIESSDPTYHTATVDSWLDIFNLDYPDKIVSFVKSEAPFITGHNLLELK